ncbi:MAG TPA: hypothetical protein VKX39_16000 [Bryobacteraceae bacterium]|nr:hypothetical protein [Bryobacteraceae bacterium]
MLALWCLLIPRCFVADTFYLVAWFYLVVWKIESAALLPGGPNPIVQARPKGKRWSGKFS